MASDSRFSQSLARFSEKLNEQVWFQQLKAKWDELDPQSRMYAKVGGAAGSALLALILVISSLASVYGKRQDLADKLDLLTKVQASSDELRRLRDSAPRGARAAEGGGAAPAWPSHFESTAATAGIDKAALSLSGEQPGAATDMAKESLFDITVKHVNIKQVVRFAYHLEHGTLPVKVRNMVVDTGNDPEGYVDATYSVSAFALK